MSDEELEIFNSDGLLIGTRNRKDVHALGLWHRGVHGFLFDSSNRLLVQKRSGHCDTFPNNNMICELYTGKIGNNKIVI